MGARSKSSSMSLSHPSRPLQGDSSAPQASGSLCQCGSGRGRSRQQMRRGAWWSNKIQCHVHKGHQNSPYRLLKGPVLRTTHNSSESVRWNMQFLYLDVKLCSLLWCHRVYSTLGFLLLSKHVEAPTTQPCFSRRLQTACSNCCFQESHYGV